jgi:hypothetical protein
MTSGWRGLVPWLLVAGVVVGLTGSPARATERLVTDPGDTLPFGAPGQLRRAIEDAASGDLIVIQVSQPIVLSGGVFDQTNAEGDLNIVGKAISIQGAGPGIAIIDGGGQSRVFTVQPGASLALSGLTVRGGLDTFGGKLFAISQQGEQVSVERPRGRLPRPPVAGYEICDLDGDGYPELVLACEWGAIRVFRYGDKREWREITNELGLDKYRGWWNGIAAGDFDGDGKSDVGCLYDYGGSTVRLFVFPSTGTSFTPVVWWSSAPGTWDGPRSTAQSPS